MNLLGVSFIVGLLHYNTAEFIAEDCWAIGFDKSNLPCSHCDLLSKFSLDALKDHCKECCYLDDIGTTERKYAKAVLEMCTCKFGAYPQIQAFIKNYKEDPSKFSNLQISYVHGLDPIIKMYNKDGHLQETVAIEKWNTESVGEFLMTHLENDDGLKSNMV